MKRLLSKFTKKQLLTGALYFMIALHYFVFFGMISAMFLSLFYQPWYIALVIITVVVRIATSTQICPLSAVEVKIQRELGLPEKDKFMKHHVLVELPWIKTSIQWVINQLKGAIK